MNSTTEARTIESRFMMPGDRIVVEPGVGHDAQRHITDVVHRSDGWWMWRCSCGDWQTASTRALAEDMADEHRQDGAE